MHKTYKRHVVQLIMENTIIITIEKGMSYSETNNAPYHKNQLCTIPYTPMIYHAIYTNDVPCHIHQLCTIPKTPTMYHTLNTNDVPYHINQRCTVPCTHPKPSGKPTSRHPGKPRIPNRRVKPTSRHRGN